MNVLEKLVEKGFNITLVSPYDQYLDLVLDKIKVNYIPLKNLDRKSVNPIKEIALFFELRKLYKELKPDLVIHYTIKPNIYGNLAAWVSRIPSICVITGLGYVFLHDTIYNSMAKKLYKVSLNKAQLVIFENHEDKDLFVQLGLVKEDRSAIVNGCGINLEYFKPIYNPKDRDSKTIFTFVARLIYDKGIIEFVEAAKKIKARYSNVEFWVAGEIDQGNPTSISNELLHKWVEEGTIKYFGHVRDVRTIISKSDCVVLPSYREAMARTLTEALAMERPVISCDTSGCRSVVDDGVNGFLVPVKNVDALIEAIEKFSLMSENSKQTMGKNGRKKAKNEFDDLIVTSQFLNLIDDVI